MCVLYDMVWPHHVAADLGCVRFWRRVGGAERQGEVKESLTANMWGGGDGC